MPDKKQQGAAFLALADALSPLVALIQGDKVVHVNPAGCALLGLRPEQIVGHDFWEFALAEDQEMVRERERARLAGVEQPRRFTQKLRHADGHDVWIDYSADVVVLDGTETIVVTGLDITEQKRTEARLRQSEESFRSLFEDTGVPKGMTSPDLRIVRVNRAYCELLGYREEELLGRSPNELSHPEDDGAAARLQRELLEGTRGSGRVLKRYRHKDGRTIWGELTLTLLRDADGAPVCFLAEVVDATERRRAEELLRDREAKLAEAQRVAHVGSWEYDIASNSSTWSDEMYRIFGVDPQGFHASRENAFERFHPEDLPRIAPIIARAIAEGEPLEYESRVVHDDGDVRSLWTIGRAQRGPDGKPLRLYGVCQDITERRRAEELLRDREAKLAEAQRVAHLGSWEYDIASQRSIWSDEMYRIFGFEPRSFEPTDSSASSRIHPEDLELCGSSVARTISDGTPYEHEFRIVLGGGELRSLWTIGRAELGPDGRPRRVYGIVQDITERKRAEQALRASEQRFHTLHSQAPVMMTVLGPDGRVREVSNFWLSRMGYTREEVIGRDPLEFATPESQERIKQQFERSIQAGEFVVHSTPIVAIRRDGSRIDALVTSMVGLDEQGGLREIVNVGMDVSHIKRAEEALRESEARYRALVEHAPEAIVVLDAQSGKFIDLNESAARLFGYERERILDMRPTDFARETQPDGRSSAEIAQREIARARAGEPSVFEWVCQHSSGRDMVCQVSLSRLPAKDRELIRSSVIEITELKLLQEKARHADKLAAIGMLAAGVAHEIGNPLLALSMAAQSLERKAADEYTQKKLVLIREHIERISRIVRQMSDLARRRTAVRTPCNLNHVVERALEIIRYDKRAKGVAIGFEPGAELPQVLAVDDQLLQVCLNLGLNALDAVVGNPPHRPRSLNVRTNLHEERGRLFVRVSFVDSGPGIPEPARAQIFQPFFTTKEPGHGTGLGLSVSYRIIEEHEGTLAFACPPPRGTDFWFQIPAEVAT